MLLSTEKYCRVYNFAMN